MGDSSDEIRFFDDYAIAYEAPIQFDEERAYLTAWTEVTNDQMSQRTFKRQQGMSGDANMILDMYREMTDAEKVETFIGG